MIRVTAGAVVLRRRKLLLAVFVHLVGCLPAALGHAMITLLFIEGVSGSRARIGLKIVFRLELDIVFRSQLKSIFRLELLPSRWLWQLLLLLVLLRLGLFLLVRGFPELGSVRHLEIKRRRRGLRDGNGATVFLFALLWSHGLQILEPLAGRELVFLDTIDFRRAAELFQ